MITRGHKEIDILIALKKSFKSGQQGDCNYHCSNEGLHFELLLDKIKFFKCMIWQAQFYQLLIILRHHGRGCFFSLIKQVFSVTYIK